MFGALQGAVYTEYIADLNAVKADQRRERYSFRIGVLIHCAEKSDFLKAIGSSSPRSQR